MKKEDPKQTERKLQADCYQWFHNTYKDYRGLLYAVPNGGTRDIREASLMKASGVVAGIPDLVFHFRARTYFFELKKPDGSGILSEDQRKIHKVLDQQRFSVWIIEDFDSFKHLIENIIGDKSELVNFGLKKLDYFYKHKIFEYIYSLADCQLVYINDIVEEGNKTKFVNFVTEFITEGYDKLDGFEILFTPDYKAIYKKLEGTSNQIKYKGSNLIN